MDSLTFEKLLRSVKQMDNILKFPTGVTATKIFCECGHALEYWVGTDNSAYGICTHCDLDQPKVIQIDEGKAE